MSNQLTNSLSEQWTVHWTAPQVIASPNVQTLSDDDELFSWLDSETSFLDDSETWNQKIKNWKGNRFSKGKGNYGPTKKKHVTRTPFTLIPTTALWLTTLRPSITKDSKRTVPGNNPFSIMYKWKKIDFEFQSFQHRSQMILDGQYISKNVLPLGIEVWRDRIFVTLPSWKQGRPVTLATVPRYGTEASPRFKPYPSWKYHAGGYSNCSGLTSVFRVTVDDCDRLWVLDTGLVTAAENASFICPPALFVFDLHTDVLIARYEIPKQFVLEDSLFANILVDSSYDDCNDLHAYLADTWGFGLVVFRERDKTFWKFVHQYFYPDPEACSYNLHGVKFQWTDGIFGTALTPRMMNGERYLYFHPLSSYREFSVKTSILKNSFKIGTSAEDFKIVGERRFINEQASASAIDRRGVMFFGMIHKDSVACWDTNKPYSRGNIAILATDHENIIFPNDVKLDKGFVQNVWVITTRLPMFQRQLLDQSDYNFRIMFANAKDVVRGTVCDPGLDTSATENYLQNPFKSNFNQNMLRFN